MDDPILGTTVEIRGERTPSPALAWLFLGLPADSPVVIEGCQLWINLVQPVVTLNFAVSAATWKLTVAVPATASLAGAEFAMQAAYTDSTGLIAVTNSLVIIGGK